MVTIDKLRELVLAFPGTTEEPYFEKISFRIQKRIFATYDKINNRACIKLSEIDQDVFSSSGKSIIYPVPNKWGKKGWTFIEMKKVKTNLFIDALTTAYCEVAPQKLSQQVRPNVITE